MKQLVKNNSLCVCFFVLVSLVSILLILPLAYAFDPPPRGVDFRGIAYIDNVAALGGSVVSMWANNGNLQMDNVTLQFGNGYYNALKIRWDDPDTAEDEGVTYDNSTLEEITFKINGQDVTNPASYTLRSSDEGATITIDLNVVTGAAAPGAGAGGGGGVVPAAKQTFQILPSDLIKVQIKQGETLNEHFIIKNFEGKSKVITFGNPLPELLVFESQEISLSANEEKKINFKIIADDDQIPDTYTGTSTFRDGSTEQKLRFSIDVLKRAPQFIINIQVNTNFRRINPGERVPYKVIINNLGDIIREAITVEFFVKDFNNNIVMRDLETVIIERALVLDRTFLFPINIDADKYAIFARIEYEDQIAVGSEVIDVEKEIEERAPKPLSVGNILIIILILLLGIVIGEAMIIYSKRKK